ncbi:MAG: ribosomal protein [Parcubacteria group bacterium]|nr:ribosomal protein [Parcubacteria group bacterium]
MASASAHLNTHRQSPRKVRVVADMVRGKSVEEALNILTFVPKRAGLPLKKLLASAVANAENLSLGNNLVVKDISVDAGKILYRSIPMAHGRAFPMRKRTSHVSITVSEAAPKAAKPKRAAKKAKAAKVTTA